MMTVLFFMTTLFLAYSNGSNDNFKGVATLWGSGVANYKTALLWATITTLAGSMCSAVLATTLFKNFSGAGLVPNNIANTEQFLVSVSLGAGLTVMLATFYGFPVSTTHSIIGAIVGCGLVSAGKNLNFGFLGKSFFLPLIISPLISMIMGVIAYLPFCGANCNCNRLLNFVGAGVFSFCRGLNDTPKIAALLLSSRALNINSSVATTGIVMAFGGLSARKVAQTMSHKIISMNSQEGFIANIITAILGLLASIFGLPVSATHISCGSIFGIGLTQKIANYKLIVEIVLAWLLTLPVSAAIGAGIYWIT